MGFVFTLLFVVTAFITPDVLFGPLAIIHPELIFAIFAVASSTPELVGNPRLTSPQMLAFGGIGLAVLISIATSGWLGGAVSALYYFLPLPFIFLMASIHLNSRSRLRLLFSCMLLVAIYFTVRGALDLHNGVVPSAFLYGDGTLRRLRGLGFVYDPNDFGQVLVALLPAMFLLKGEGFIGNILRVGIPITALITGLYLTHSRGAAVALMVVLIFALRRKFGTIPALVLAGCFFAGSLALGWSGGRDVSMEAGADRMDAWSTGLELIKSHPFAGVGIQRFGDYNSGLTAHNTVVVCAAEIGLVGFFFWVMLVFTTLRNAIRMGEVLQSAKGKDAEKSREQPFQGRRYAETREAVSVPAVSSSSPRLRPRFGSALASGTSTHAETSAESVEELKQMVRLTTYSLIGFLAAGWFLSRAMSLWLFLIAGITDGLVRTAKDRGTDLNFDSLPFIFRWSALIAASLIVIVYVILRSRHFFGA